MKKKHIIIAVCIMLFSSLFFYWFEWRPSDIRYNCTLIAKKNAILVSKKRVEMDKFATDFEKDAVQQGMYKDSDREKYYQDCLREEGLEK